MTIEDGRFYNPSDGDMQDAFRIMDARYFSIGDSEAEIKKLPPEKLTKATKDYLLTGIAFLSNCVDDPYLNDIAAATWWAIQKGRTKVTSNLMGLSQMVGGLVAETLDEDQASVNLLGTGTIKSGVQRWESIIYLPASFLYESRTNPINSLSLTTWICSMTRDFDNGRLVVDPEYVGPRANASRAQFLRQALTLNPNAEVKRVHRNILFLFPKGIDSLDQHSRYKGMNPLGFSS